jgi:hypothetical protein
MISILNYIDYDKQKAMQVLVGKLDWKYYGGKHYESTYTKFYQGVILPEKFNIDKRKLHLSALILSGQMSRNEAIEELNKPIYPIENVIEDKEYVAKKFEMDLDDFNDIMNRPNKTFRDYPNNYKFHSNLRKYLNILRQKKLYYS